MAGRQKNTRVQLAGDLASTSTLDLAAVGPIFTRPATYEGGDAYRPPRCTALLLLLRALPPDRQTDGHRTVLIRGPRNYWDAL